MLASNYAIVKLRMNLRGIPFTFIEYKSEYFSKEKSDSWDMMKFLEIFKVNPRSQIFLQIKSVEYLRILAHLKKYRVISGIDILFIPFNASIDLERM